MSRTFDRIVILGLGLIGGSLARAINEKKLAGHLAAYNKSPEALEYALQHKFIDSGYKTAQEAVKDADLIIFATPPTTFADIAAAIAPHVRKGAIITDVGSVKRHTIKSIRAHLSNPYVPAHPIAGGEKAGVEAGKADLFFGKKVILTPEEKELMSEPVTRVRDIWTRIGAKIEYMPADLHDLIYAYVSHLPQIVAFAVEPLVDKNSNNELYKRFTRLTHSNHGLWKDIFLANADYVGRAVNDYLAFLTQIHGELRDYVQDNVDKNADVNILFAGLLAHCLIATASLLEEQVGINPIRYAGGGFKDMTAIAAHDPHKLLEAISGNSSNIVPVLEKMLDELNKIKQVYL